MWQIQYRLVIETWFHIIKDSKIKNQVIIHHATIFRVNTHKIVSLSGIHPPYHLHASKLPIAVQRILMSICIRIKNKIYFWLTYVGHCKICRISSKLSVTKNNWHFYSIHLLYFIIGKVIFCRKSHFIKTIIKVSQNIRMFSTN